MSDHADTIRREVERTRAMYVKGTPERYPDARVALRILDVEALLAERQQAIDALREIATGFDGDEFQDPADGQERQQTIARAALLSLGEQP